MPVEKSRTPLKIAAGVFAAAALLGSGIYGLRSGGETVDRKTTVLRQKTVEALGKVEGISGNPVLRREWTERTNRLIKDIYSNGYGRLGGLFGSDGHKAAQIAEDSHIVFLPHHEHNSEGLPYLTVTQDGSAVSGTILINPSLDSSKNRDVAIALLLKYSECRQDAKSCPGIFSVAGGIYNSSGGLDGYKIGFTPATNTQAQVKKDEELKQKAQETAVAQAEQAVAEAENQEQIDKNMRENTRHVVMDVPALPDGAFPSVSMGDRKLGRAALKSPARQAEMILTDFRSFILGGVNEGWFNLHNRGLPGQAAESYAWEFQDAVDTQWSRLRKALGVGDAEPQENTFEAEALRAFGVIELNGRLSYARDFLRTGGVLGQEQFNTDVAEQTKTIEELLVYIGYENADDALAKKMIAEPRDYKAETAKPVAWIKQAADQIDQKAASQSKPRLPQP